MMYILFCLPSCECLIVIASLSFITRTTAKMRNYISNILIRKAKRFTNLSNLFLEKKLASSQHNLYDIYLLLCVQC